MPEIPLVSVPISLHSAGRVSSRPGFCAAGCINFFEEFPIFAHERRKQNEAGDFSWVHALVKKRSKPAHGNTDKPDLVIRQSTGRPDYFAV
jgi:hypothetical protein